MLEELYNVISDSYKQMNREFETPLSEISETTSLKDLDMDSVSFVVIMMNIEEKMKDYNLTNEEYSDLEHDYNEEIESNAYRAVMTFLDEYNRIIKRENKEYRKSGDPDIKDDQINQKARMNLEFYESMKNVLNE